MHLGSEESYNTSFTDSDSEVNLLVNRTLSTLLYAITQKNLKTWEECLSHVDSQLSSHLLKLCMVSIH